MSYGPKAVAGKGGKAKKRPATSKGTFTGPRVSLNGLHRQGDLMKESNHQAQFAQNLLAKYYDETLRLKASQKAERAPLVRLQTIGRLLQVANQRCQRLVSND